MPKITLAKNDMQDKSYTLSGHMSFIHRYADTGFRTKWCGIWMPPYKLFEYFAFKVNDTWLSPADITGFSIEKRMAAHTFITGGISVNEIIFTPKKIPAIIAHLHLKNTTIEKKEICVELEAAVNIRTKSENFHTRGYETDISEENNMVAILSDGKYAAFGAGKFGKKASVEFSKNESYKEHYPGGEMQRCFVPGSYKVKFSLGAGEEIILPFVFSGSLSSKEDLVRDYMLCFHDAKNANVMKHPAHNHLFPEINTPDAEINDTYAWSASNIFGLMHESTFGTGLFAGYPWFLEFWGRDTFWSLLGIIDLGGFEKAKEIIRTMANFQKEMMPCVLNLDGTAKYHGRDVDALFLIALDRYILESGDTTAEKEFGKNIKSSMDSLSLKNGFVQHEPNETWMDSISRQSTAIEIQSLWIEALKKREPKTASIMLEALNESFCNQKTGFLNDTAGSSESGRITPNAFVPLMFGQVQKMHPTRVLEAAKAGLLGNYGIATLSKDDKDYGPAKYHEGATWGLTSALGACAFLKNGKPNDALFCLKAMAADSKKHMLGGMSECLNSETGELLGCGMQLWSAALFIHAIDSYLFGICSESGKIAIAPQMPSGWKFMERKNKKLGSDIFDISVIKGKGRYEFDIRFIEPPKRKIVIKLPDNVISAEANSKQIRINAGAGSFSEIMEIKDKVIGKLKDLSTTSIEFEAEKCNTVIIRTI